MLTVMERANLLPSQKEHWWKSSRTWYDLQEEEVVKDVSYVTYVVCLLQVDDFLLVVDHHLNSFKQQQREKVSGLKMFIGGQSLGGLVAVHTALRSQHLWSGLLLHSPALDVEWTNMLRYLCKQIDVCFFLSFWATLQSSSPHWRFALSACACSTAGACSPARGHVARPGRC
jgi:hypothetical protein